MTQEETTIAHTHIYIYPADYIQGVISKHLAKVLSAVHQHIHSNVKENHMSSLLTYNIVTYYALISSSTMSIFIMVIII